MTELVLVFLNSNVVRAVVHMDGPVLCSQPHRRLTYNSFTSRSLRLSLSVLSLI